jgi:type II secretory pathway component PulM
MKQTLNEQIEEQQAKLAELELQRTTISARMRQAATSADADEISALQREASELPTKIQTARIIAERLNLQYLEERLPIARAELEKLHKPLAEAIEKHEPAMRERNLASAAVTNASEDVRQLRIEIGAKKRMIDTLIYESQPQGLRRTA